MTKEVDMLLTERFGKDSLIALATAENDVPYVRTVDAIYHDGAFHCITHLLSGKMQQIEKNSTVAVCGEWFTGHGRAQSLGPVRAPENQAIADMLRKAFASWYDNGHTDEDDPNTIILRITLTDGVLYSNGTRYEV